MNKNVEYEDRIMIGQNDYLNFKKIFPFDSIFEQTNLYFDSPDLYLTKTHQVLRLRIIDKDKYELTLKINRGECCDELNQPLSQSEALNFIHHLIFPNEEFKQWVIQTHVDMNQIKKVGEITTFRSEVKIEDYLLVLDKNIYANIVDYNLEVEANSFQKAHAVIIDLAARYHLTYQDNYISKSKRAILANKD